MPLLSSNFELFSEVDKYMRSMKCKCVDYKNIPCLYSPWSYDPVGFIIRNHLSESIRYMRIDFSGNQLENLLDFMGYSTDNIVLLSSLQTIHDNVPIYFWRRHLTQLRRELE